MPNSVLFADGSRGTINLRHSGADTRELAEVLLENGQTLVVPNSMLISSDGGYCVALQPSAFDIQSKNGNGEIAVIPIVEEELEVSKREIATKTVRLIKSVTERQEIVDQPLLRNEVDVRRVTINQFVDAAPPVRYEGDTMIIPVVEEVMVVQKRIRLIEEVYVAHRQTVYRDPQTVSLRKETMTGEQIQLLSK